MATYIVVIFSMVGLLIFPFLSSHASVAANFTNNGAPTASFNQGTASNLVLDLTIPDAWNGAASTADTLVKDGSASWWQGDTLNTFVNAGTVNGVGYDNTGTAVGFQGTEPVIIDLDGDGTYTSGPDIFVDGDGSTTPGPGVAAGISAGDPLVDVKADSVSPINFSLCTDSLTNPTAVRMDTDTDNCGNNGANDGTYILGTSATPAAIRVTNAWAFKDTNGNGKYNDTEDIYIENVANMKTYSASVDTDVYGTGGIVGNPALTSFAADCDGVGPTNASCKFTGTTPIDSTEDIYIDNGTFGGVAQNDVVDRQDDQLIGLGVQNTGTAVNTTDISAVKVWLDGGAAGFQGVGSDTVLGTMTVNSGNSREWRLGGLTQVITAGGVRIYVSSDISANATVDSTQIFSLPIYNDAGANNIVSQDNDRGFFVSSNNDGPTNLAVTNANTQTIVSAGTHFSSTPTNNSILINNNAASTSSTVVNLNIASSGASQMVICNDINFTDCSWETYSASKSWILPFGLGTKRVYALFKSSAGDQSAVVSDNIELVAATEGGTPTETKIITQEAAPAQALPAGVEVGWLVKANGSPDVYFLDNDNRRHTFPNENTYFSWFTDFSNVRTLATETLATIPLGSNVTVREGTWLIKIQTDPKVYAVEPYGILLWIQTEEIASALYGSTWNTRIIDLDPSFFENYQLGTDITQAIHPTGSVIRYSGDTTNYYIDSGAREFISDGVFANNLLQSKFICTDIALTLNYDIGANLVAEPIQTLMLLR